MGSAPSRSMESIRFGGWCAAEPHGRRQSQRSRSGSSQAGPSTATHLDVVEPGISGLGQQLVRQVEEGGGEPAGDVAGVAVLAVGQVALDDRLEARARADSRGTTRPGGGIAADCGRRQHAAWAKNAAPLGQRPYPVGAFCEVVERAQQQHRVDGRIGPVAARAHHRGMTLAKPGHGPCLLDVQRHRIDQVNLVSTGPPAARRAHRPRRPRRERLPVVAVTAGQQVLGALELQPACACG